MPDIYIWQVVRLHLPDVERPVGAAHQQEIVLRLPLDRQDGEDLLAGEHDAP
jgi:hypothetical protein